jgi:membrane peptidoglycan carboxypeptidase
MYAGKSAGMGIGRPAAGKTGTVDDYSSAWFAGYTPDLASAVWVGDPRGGYAHPLKNVCLAGRCYGEVFGADIPAPIWRQTMLGALRNTPAHDFHSPPSEYYREGSGEDRVQVPDVTGMDASEARARLEAAGFGVSTGPSVSSAYPKGTVARTSPGAGSRVEPGTTVTIYPSRGRPRIPPFPPPGQPPGGPPGGGGGGGGGPTFPPPTFPPIGGAPAALRSTK